MSPFTATEARAYDRWKTDAPEEPEEDCNHKWKLLGRAKDGACFYVCRLCGIQEEA